MHGVNFYMDIKHSRDIEGALIRCYKSMLGDYNLRVY